ncbi:conserved hypothetical protein, partial [Trichinella spiralis]|uniref:hypothetical protein n=1 Tax=Trichinella spiralis TaxID=6334 RepID=UPI0001EFEF83
LTKVQDTCLVRMFAIKILNKLFNVVVCCKVNSSLVEQLFALIALQIKLWDDKASESVC